MKKYVILIIILIIISPSKNLFSSCPVGYNSTILTLGPEPGTGCYWDFTICYKCSPLGLNPGDILIIDIQPNNLTSGCTSPNQSWADSQILQSYSNLCTVPSCSTCLTITIQWALCYHWKTYGTFDGLNYHYYSWLAPCVDDGYCVETHKVCRNPDDGLIIPCPGWNITYTSNGYNCQTDPISEPTNFDPDFTDIKVTSDCFLNNSCP